MRGKRREWHGWALRVSADDCRALSSNAEEGLDYAAELAETREQAIERFLAARRGDPLLARLSIKDLAEREGVSPATVKRRIAQARRELFGEVEDRAIYAKLARRQGKAGRRCAEDGCHSFLPRESRASRRYCDAHASPAGRARRSRSRRSLRPMSP